MAKPFSMDELVARIEALGRRAASGAPDDVLKVEDLRMEVRSRRVTRAGKRSPCRLGSSRSCRCSCRSRAGRFPRTELCERVWQRDHEYDTRTVEIFIARLRKKIDTGFSPPLVQTLRGVGYSVRAAERLPA